MYSKQKGLVGEAVVSDLVAAEMKTVVLTRSWLSCQVWQSQLQASMEWRGWEGKETIWAKKSQPDDQNERVYYSMKVS